MNKNWEWNDELANEYATKYYKGEFPVIVGKSFMDIFKESKIHKPEHKEYEIVVKDYQILTCHLKDISSHSIHPYQPLICLGKDKNVELCEIYSVMRISDKSVFTIGDYCYGDYIKGFKTKNNTLYVLSENSRWELYLNDLKKEVEQPIPLFTTEDGIEKFVNDSVWVVSDSFCKFNRTVGTEVWITEQPFKFFHSVQKAEEYILFNKRVLCLQDIYDHFKKYFGYGDGVAKNKLKELVKSRIQ